ncbi:MAG: MBL fold metallo-hydrolase, partial [Deltaproteobacteria bacterium]|nr:MBL fold metallo-hydrolase [Deltaproteobacteria bacterium]
MKIDRLVVSPFEMNCFILSCEKTLEAAIIDAGFEADRILSFIEQKGYRLKYLINTHAHVDHVSAVAEIKKRTGAPFL